MDEIVKKKDQVWIATFKDVVAYHKERNASTLSVVEKSNREWKLSLTDTLSNNAAYHVPLTIRIKNPTS
jgi:glutamine cyclotransferase